MSDENKLGPPMTELDINTSTGGFYNGFATSVADEEHEHREDQGEFDGRIAVVVPGVALTQPIQFAQKCHSTNLSSVILVAMAEKASAISIPSTS